MNFFVEAATFAESSFKCSTIYPFFLIILPILFFANIYALILLILGIYGLYRKKTTEGRIVAKKRVKRALIIMGIYIFFILIDEIFIITPQWIIGGCAPHHEIWDRPF